MKKLEKYVLTSATLSLTVAKAAVVYTDVDPDITLNVDGDQFEIDFNSDGNAEYQVIYEVENPGYWANF